MSGSPGCPAFWFSRASLPAAVFGVHDAALAECARRRRFLLRRRDPEFLEVFSSVRVVADGGAVEVVAVVPVVEVAGAPVGVRRSRRVAGLDAEFDEVLRGPRRQRSS